MSRQVIVDIVGDSSKFSKSIDAATTKTGGFGSVLKGFGAGIGLGIFDAVTSSLSGFVGGLGDAAAAYREDQASQALLGQALQNNIPNWNGSTAAIEELVTANERLGFSDDEQRQALAKLVGETHNQEEAQNILSTAMDLARLKGIDLGTATDALIKAHNGNFKALKDVGVETDKNTTFTQALAQVQKIAQGQAETYAATSEGKVAASQLKVGEAMEKLGGIVDSVAQVALPLLADAFTTVIDWVGKAYDAIKPLIDQLSKSLGPAISTIGDIFKKVFDFVVPFIQTAATVLGVAFGVIGTAIDVLVGIVGGIWTAAETVVNNVTGAFNGLVTFFQGVPTAIGNAVSGMWNGIWEGFRSVINSIIRGWNGLQFTVPSIDLGPLGSVGGFTLGVPTIPYLHKGGVVPGPRGSDVLAILQAGEKVIPMGKASSAPTSVNITVNVTGSNADEISDKTLLKIRRALDRQGMSLA